MFREMLQIKKLHNEKEIIESCRKIKTAAQTVLNHA